MLGIVLVPNGRVPGAYPWEILSSKGTAGYLRPHDPYQYQRGEAGYYHDTPLGALPTDAEQAICYTPVKSGWIATDKGYINPPWTPPNGWTPAGQYKAPVSLGQTGPDYERWGFYLATISTLAMVAIATANAISAIRAKRVECNV